MANEINLTSQRWNDIIFEGKNKDYGAYEMRKSSSKRHITALFVLLTFAVFVSLLPFLVKTLTPVRTADNLSDSNILTELTKLEDQIQEKDIIRAAAAEPPPVLKATIQFTLPEIVDRADITDENQFKSQADVLESTATVSVLDVAGTNEGVDIETLNQHKVIAADEGQVHDFVEQMPEFPGGEAALMKFLGKNTQYPEIAAQNRMQGRVQVQFVVSETGAVTEVAILTGVNDRSLQAEAIRVVKSMPKWIPGRQNGQAVKVRYSVPIQFKLTD